MDRDTCKKLPIERGGRASAALLSVLAIFCLAGCSGKPSSADVKKAVSQQFEQAAQQAKQLGGDAGRMFEVEVHEVKLLDCVPAQPESGYNCDIEMDVTSPYGGRQESVVQVRMVKGSKGWTLIE